MRCMKCGAESTTGRKFCAACGSLLCSRCPNCGAENAPASVFCEDCGSALARDVTPAAICSSQTGSTAPNIRIMLEQTGTTTVADAERKKVTALFTDIKGPTELKQELDPAAQGVALRMNFDHADLGHEGVCGELLISPESAIRHTHQMKQEKRGQDARFRVRKEREPAAQPRLPQREFMKPDDAIPRGPSHFEVCIPVPCKTRGSEMSEKAIGKYKRESDRAQRD